MSCSLKYCKTTADDTVKAETWVRYENKLSYSRNTSIAALAALLGGNFSFTQPFETYTLSQTANTFSNALTAAGFMGDGSDEERPFAYINYILFDENMVMQDAGWKRVDEDAGFDPGQEALTFHQHKKLAFDSTIKVLQDGYIYIWVSNESEGTKVWFDDVKVTHTQVVVTQATDYGVWGDVLRELKSAEITYRHGYQGNFSEKDEETGWNHFELREYDPVIGRWNVMDPKRVGFSSYIGMSNDPINLIDPDGGDPWKPDENGNLIAEAGDNAATLATYLNISEADAMSMICDQLKTNTVSVGDMVCLSNNYTRSIENGGRITSELFFSGEYIKRGMIPDKNDYYNCFGSAISGTSGLEINPSTSNMNDACKLKIILKKITFPQLHKKRFSERR